MTPCENLGYKVGDRFMVVKSNPWFKIGVVLTLYKDDGSDNPSFETDKGGRWYLSLNHVKPFNINEIHIHRAKEQ